MIPLVSTLCQGPLGVAQLPRLWWKNLLHQAGQLDADYPFCSGGLDKYVLEVLRLDQDRALNFLWDQRPTYLQFEEWVTAEGTHEDTRIARWNKSLVSAHPLCPGQNRRNLWGYRLVAGGGDRRIGRAAQLPTGLAPFSPPRLRPRCPGPAWACGPYPQ